MNCGVICLLEYLKELGLESDEVKESLMRYVRYPYVSMYEMMEVLQPFGIEMEAYHWNKIDKKGPYLIYLKKQKHFMLVKQVGWMVTLFDQRIQNVKIPYFLYRFLYQGYYLKIVD